MRQKMAGVNECFSIGSIVSCKTCYNKEIEGEVLAFDPQTKMLILKCPASNGQAPLNDVHIINLSLVSDVQVKKEVNTVPEPPQSLDFCRLNSRVRNQIDEKRRLVTALSASVPPEGQKLFFAISKTFRPAVPSGHSIELHFSNDGGSRFPQNIRIDPLDHTGCTVTTDFVTIKEVSWQGSNIVVFDTVTITPPYKLDNVRGHAECKALLHIRKVVEKHMREQAAAEAASSAAGAQTSPQ